MSREQNTEKFLQEYSLYRQLLENNGEKVKLENNESIIAPDKEDEHFPQVEVGQIRLLAGIKEIVYVLVLSKWEDDIWLIVPFSPFSSPATDEEILLGGKRTEYLDVLQIWNTRTIHNLLLRSSFLVDMLTEKELDFAFEAYKCSFIGKAMSSEMLEKTGVPIYEADDLRFEYKQESLARFSAIDSADFALCMGDEDTEV